jgi:hypothetical protein
MGRFILGAACLAALVPAAHGQELVNYRTTAIGCQRITDFIVVEIVGAPRKLEAEGKGQIDTRFVTLTTKDWKNGDQFTDATGKLWRLAYGPTLPHNPPQLTGTLTHPGDGRVLFLSSGGTLFIRIEKQ